MPQGKSLAWHRFSHIQMESRPMKQRGAFSSKFRCAIDGLVFPRGTGIASWPHFHHGLTTRGIEGAQPRRTIAEAASRSSKLLDVSDIEGARPKVARLIDQPRNPLEPAYHYPPPASTSRHLPSAPLVELKFQRDTLNIDDIPGAKASRCLLTSFLTIMRPSLASADTLNPCLQRIILLFFC